MTMRADDEHATTLLAFDTSTEQLAVALAAAGQELTADLPGGAAASTALLPAAEALLRRVGRSARALTAVAFGAGPGAFTGLRTSCAVAQGLAFGCGCPVLPIGSLSIVAEQVRLQHGAAGGEIDVGVAMDARMGEVYAARWRWWQGVWHELEAARLWSLQALDEHWSRDMPTWCAGSALQAHGDALARGCPPPRRLDTGLERAAALLSLARQAWRAQAGVDPALALPVYLRDKVALTTAERDAARAMTVR